MAKNYSYPRVTISQYAKTRSSVAPAAEDTTVLFMPFIAEKGIFGKDQESYQPVRNLSEFIDRFGNLKFEDNGQTALIIYNWLNAGGTLFPYRLNNYASTKTIYGGTSDVFQSKYIGEFYNNLSIVLTPLSASFLQLEVKHTENGLTTTIESMRFTESTMDSNLDASQFIELYPNAEWSDVLGCVDTNKIGTSVKVSVKTSASKLADNNDLYTLVKTLWTNPNDTTSLVYKSLSNSLQSPVDVIMDAGYSKDIKNLMIQFIDNASENATRPDIVGLFDNHEIVYDKTAGKFTGKESVTRENTVYGIAADIPDGFQFAHTNVAVWDQYFVIEDAIFTDKDINVTPTYFLSKLIPYNDIVYGVQYPTAGLRRGILEDAKKVFTNPTPDEKETMFKNRINYCEKSAREYAFMSQRTWDGSTAEKYTALSFLNNVRALERMKKDLNRIGREYLFEHNDSVTLSQMSNVLNRYMATWTANRTLSYAEVTVAPNAWSTESVDVTLVIRFNNTIEVISVDITIE